MKHAKHPLTASARSRKSSNRLARILLSLALLTVTAMLAACGGGNGNDADAPASSASAEDNTAMRTITDAMGHEVQVPGNPQRIIAPFLEDPLAALGVKPVAQWGAAGNPQQYLQDRLADVPVLNMQGGLQTEETLSYEPDLIIFMAPTYLPQGNYDQFAKIAPTFVLSENETDWRGNIEKLGVLLNKEEEAKQALEQYDLKISEAKSALGNLPSEKTAILMQGGDEENFLLFGPDFYGGITLYRTLGFRQPEVLKGDYETYSLEALAELQNVDYIFVISGEGRAKPPQNSSLWKSLPAVQAGHVFEADSGHWFNDNLIANGLIVDDVLKYVHE